jgi:hypothetical protein
VTRRIVTARAAEVGRVGVEWLSPGRVPIGLVTVLAGLGGVGKSQWACLLAAQLSRGELGEPAESLIATAEDLPSTTVVPRLEALDADLRRIHFLTIATESGEEDGIAIPDDIAQLEDVSRELGARLIVVDPLVAHLPLQIDSHRDQSVRRALAPLYRLASTVGCAVIAVLHLNKTQGLAPLARLGGSSAFGNAARSVLLLDRDPDDENGERGSRRVLAHIKCNVAPLASSLLYEVRQIVLPADGDAPMVETSRLELLGESAYDGGTLLASTSDQERTDLEEATDFLRDYLANGLRHPAKEIYRAAADLHIANHTLKRARVKIGAKTAKGGFGSGWEWFLPEENTPAATATAKRLAATKRNEQSTPTHRFSSMTTEGNNRAACSDEENTLGSSRERRSLRERSEDEIATEVAGEDCRTLEEALRDRAFVEELIADRIIVAPTLSFVDFTYSAIAAHARDAS